MTLRDQRAPTTEREHAAAVADAETRLGRKLTDGEKRIDIVGIDRDLKNGKQRLHDAVAAEQRRAAAAYAENREPIQLKVTDEMIAALADLYDAGVQHATAELESAGIAA